jgi:uncharacterized protein
MVTGRMAELPDPGDRSVPRYSQRAFPAYRYVPGVHAHPRRDPTGHSYRPAPQLDRHPPWAPEEWRTLDDWLYGVDLFNRFYFWEAHEAWEGLWAAAERGGSASLLLQGLIQIAAALLKTHMGVLSAARALSSEGLDKLQRAAATHPRLLGLDLQSVKEGFAHYFASLERNELPIIGPEVPALQPTAGLCL